MNTTHDEIPLGWHPHLNGGGLVGGTAYVSETVYVGPDAKVYVFELIPSHLPAVENRDSRILHNAIGLDGRL